MALSKAEQKARMKQLGQLVQDNDIAGLTRILKELETGLSGHDHWYHHTSECYVECAIRDALLAGKKEIAELFFDAGASLDSYAFIKGNSGYLASFMHFAVNSGKLEMVQLLVERGVQMHPRDRDDWNKDFGLKSAVNEGHTDIAEYLLARGAEADGLCGGGTLGEMHGGTTFIAKAAQDGNVQLVESLLKHGAKIKSAFSLAHEKLYKHGICEYNSAIERNYSSKERISKLDYAFDVFSKNRSKFYSDYKLTAAGKAFFEKLNEQLLDLAVLDNSEVERSKFIAHFTAQLAELGITQVDTHQMMKELERLTPSLRAFDDKKRELEQKREQMVKAYASMIKILMDYAMGCDFDKKQSGSFGGEYGGLQFLEDFDVSGVNFIGVSVDGEPVTHDMLKRLGVKGAEYAIVTIDDLNALPDLARINKLTNLLSQALQKNGEITDAQDVFNLIPLTKAAEMGNEPVVRARLAAGIDPHENSPLITAAKKGHLDIVKILMASLAYHARDKITQLIAEAEEQLAVPQEFTAACVQEGRIKKILVPFNSASYLAVTTNDDYMNFARLSSRFKKSGLDLDIEKAMSDAKSLGMHCMCVIKHGLVLEKFYYSKDVEPRKLQEFLDECIKKTGADRGRDYFPLMFIDKTNHAVIHRLIETQYKKIIETGKQSTVEAIKVARQEKHNAVAEYIESQQDVNAVNKEGDTLLHIAVKTGDLKRVKELIGRGIDVNIKNKDGLRAISMAASGCRQYKQEVSLVYLYILRCLLDNKSKVDNPTLLAAVNAGSSEALALLLSRATLKDVSYEDYSDYSNIRKLTKPWYIDLMYGSLRSKHTIRLLTLLKEYGADFNRRDDNRMTLLSNAVNNLPSFENILSTMSDIRHSTAGMEDRVGPEVMQTTYTHLVKDDQKQFEKELRLLNYLLDNGANPGCSDEDGTTPLHNLIMDKDLRLVNNGYEALLDKLFEKGADVNALTKQKATPLHAAARTGDIVAVNYLLKHQARVDASDEQGNTPLHDAAERCFSITTKALIAGGALTTAKNNKGLTPLDVLESSYAEKKKDLTDRYATAQEERAKETRGFYGRKDSSQDFHLSYRKALDKLDSSYSEINAALSAAAAPPQKLC